MLIMFKILEETPDLFTNKKDVSLGMWANKPHIQKAGAKNFSTVNNVTDGKK